MAINLFIIGPSGSGKSTQAKLIAKKYHLTHISTGQQIRLEMEAQTKLGILAKKYVDQGLWCPDEIVLKVLFRALNKVKNRNFIVDGTPRLPGQPKPIEDHLKKHNQSVTALVQLTLPFQTILERRQKKGAKFQDKSRSDNTPEAIKKRNQEYNKYLKPILKFYRIRNQLIKVDGDQPVEPIFDDICQKINELLIKDKGKTI